MPRLVREALYKTAIAAGMTCVDEVLEADKVGCVECTINTWLSARRCGPATSALP